MLGQQGAVGAAGGGVAAAAAAAVHQQYSEASFLQRTMAGTHLGPQGPVAGVHKSVRFEVRCMRKETWFT